MLPPCLSWTPRTSGMSSSCNSFTSRRTWNVSSGKCVKPTGHQTSHAFQVISSQVISLHLLRLPNPLQLLMVWSRPSPLGDPPVFVGGKSCYDNSPNDTRQHWWTSTGLATYGAYLKFCCDFLFGHRKNHHLFFRTAADPQNERRELQSEKQTTGRNCCVSTISLYRGFQVGNSTGTPTASQVWQELYQEFGLWHNDVLNVHNLQHRGGKKRHNWMGC